MIITNTMSEASEFDIGHNAVILIPHRSSERNSVFSGPRISQRNPQAILPTAEEKLKPATRPAPVLEERPSEWLYMGRKKGGTKSGNVPTAPATKRITNRKSRKRRLENFSALHAQYHYT